MTKYEAVIKVRSMIYTTLEEIYQLGWPHDGYQTEEERLLLEKTLLDIIQVFK